MTPAKPGLVSMREAWTIIGCCKNTFIKMERDGRIARVEVKTWSKRAPARYRRADVERIARGEA